MVEIPRIQNADLNNKKVLVRVDHNVIKKGIIKDHFRIDASIDTIKYIIAKGGKPILMSHVGRPRDKKTGKINISNDTSVVPIVNYLKNRFNLNFNIAFDNIPDFSKPDYMDKLLSGDIDGLYLPNTRWFKGEENNDERT